MATDKLDPPKPTRADTVQILARAGLSAIPIVGGSAAELFQLIIQPPLNRRRVEWMDAVGRKLLELEDKGIDIQGLAENEKFISVVMHASQIALRSHQEEKLTALRNAVINTAIGQSPEESLAYMFLEWIDSLSMLHLQILRIFQNPTPRPGMSMGGLSNVLEYQRPDLSGYSHIYRQAWKDLYARGLVDTDAMNTTMSAEGLAAKRTTEIGDEFLFFLSDPDL